MILIIKVNKCWRLLDRFRDQDRDRDCDRDCDSDLDLDLVWILIRILIQIGIRLDSDDRQSEDVGNKKDAAAVFVHQRGDPPDVSEHCFAFRFGFGLAMAMTMTIMASPLVRWTWKSC